MSSLSSKISYLIDNQLPEYVRATYPVFADFLTAYYAFLEAGDSSPNSLLQSSETWTDISTTLDEFLPVFKAQYALDFPADTAVDIRRLIRFLHEFYEGKGSETAIAMFFRFLLGQDSSVVYPGQYVLKASGGNWVQRHYVKLDTTQFSSLDVYELQDTTLSLAYLEDIETVGLVLRRLDNIKCFNIVKNQEGALYTLQLDLAAYDFPLCSAVTNFDFNGTGHPITIDTLGDYDTHIYVQKRQPDGTYTTYGSLLTQLVGVSAVDEAGTRFLKDETFTIMLYNASGTDEAADLTDLDNVTGGRPNIYGDPDFDMRGVFRVVRTTDGLGVKEVRIVDPGSKYSTRSYDVVVDGLQYFASDYFEDSGDYAHDTQTPVAETQFRVNFNPSDDAGTFASVVFDLGVIFTEPGSFKTSAGFLSDVYHMQDNQYYQMYSYVIRAEAAQAQWKDAYTTIAHPAGFSLFSQTQIPGDETTSPLIDFNYTSVAVTDTITIVTQPQNADVDGPLPIQLSVVATLSPYYEHLTYQWQYSTDGGDTWHNTLDGDVYGGSVTDTLSITDATGLDTVQYQCVLSGPHDSLTTDPAILYSVS